MSTISNLIKTRLKELKQYVIKDTMPVEPWSVRHAKFLDFGKYEYIDEPKDVNVGDIWARTGETAFMKTSVVIPEKWKGEYVAFEFMTGGEGLLTLNGKPYSGADDNRGYIRICEKAIGGEKFEFEVEIKTGGYWEYLPDEEYTQKPYLLSKSCLSVIDKVVEKVYLDFYFTYSVVKGYKDEILRDKVLSVMYDAFKLVDFTQPTSPKFKEELLKADDFMLKEFKAIDWHSALGKNGYCGNSHIDVLWLWPLKETQRKVGRTYNTLVTLMEEYPDYIFNFSQVPLFKYLEKNYLETFKKVKEYIKEGRVEPIGGTWVENDTNLVSGESLVRQCLYGQRYMRGVLGADVRVGYIPDVFGYSYALPQVYKKSGLEYFLTTKLSWQDTNKFPYDVFWWEGLDGTKILTYLPRQYVDAMDDLEVHREVTDAYRDRLKCSDYLALIGWGDGGGGPTREAIEAIRRFDNIPGYQKGYWTTVHDFFDNVVSKSENLPTYNDELYFEYHRGTYTNQAKNKKFNRKSELALHDAELLSVIAKPLGVEYPKEEMVSYWENVLLNQFHDCIPGSCIADVYEQTDKDYEKILAGCKKIAQKALEAIAKGADTTGEGTPIFVFNTLSHNRFDIATVSWTGDKNVVVCDSEGNVVNSQIIEGSILFEAEVPSMGYAVYFVKPGEREEEITLNFDGKLITSQFYEIGINPDGTIGAIWDNEMDRNVLPPLARANVLELFEDKPTDYDAWELEHDFENRKWEWEKVKGPELVEMGPVRMVLRTEYKTEKSTLSQDMIVYANKPTIDFKTKVNWQEEHTLFKAAFPVDIRSKRATFDIAYGLIERSTTNNTSKEQAQWEVSGHKWADLSETDYGVSILNDCKYGWDIKDNLMRITLLRSSKWPDPKADVGEHEFTYSLFAHEGSYLADTIELASDLNTPFYAFVTDTHKGEDKALSYVTVNTENVIVDCVKEAEDDDSVIVRVFEPMGARGPVFLEFDKGIVSCVETNLLEEEVKSQVEVEEYTISFMIKPFEIRTFKIKFLDE
ncbi:MAG: alpha-mannosidase [Abditibacteriota bacterium]|nr:alpha-mannosidase [Abditibacteriota bacterium]